MKISAGAAITTNTCCPCWWRRQGTDVDHLILKRINGSKEATACSTLNRTNCHDCQLVSKHNCHRKAVMSWSCLHLRVVSSQATEDLATLRMERWHGCQSPDMSCVYSVVGVPSYHKPAPKQHGGYGGSESRGTLFFPGREGMSLLSFPVLRRITSGIGHADIFDPEMNVVTFIRIWSQIPNTLRRPQQFSTFNWDTTTEVVTLYQVPLTGETLTSYYGT